MTEFWMTDAELDIPFRTGNAREQFENVLYAFSRNFSEDAELGASFAVFVDGEAVVDVRGGFVDRARKVPWAEDTLACIYSSGKAALAFLIARAVSDGKLDYEAPVAQYWPQFSANGKQAITVGQAMSHQGGLCAIPDKTMPPEAWLDWSEITGRIAAMAPLWEPATASGYHPQTFGFIAGELLRRTEGKTVGRLLSDIGLQMHCGLSPEQLNKSAFMPKPPKAPVLGEITDLKRLAFLSASSTPGRVAREDWAAAQIPASNMHANARALAEIVYPFANQGRTPGGRQVLTGAVIEAALKERIRGDDLVLPFNLSWTAGLMRNINGHFGPNENAVGHAGFGGSCVVIDPDNKMTAAYVMNKMSPYLVGDPRALRLLSAVYSCL